MGTTPYRIENLDVYRRSLVIGTKLYRSAGNGGGAPPSPVAQRVRENALAMVLNLAAGLGFWEREWKVTHLVASKRAAVELTPLLELMVALKELPPESETEFAAELQDLLRMIGGLLRQARRREADDGPRAAGTDARGHAESAN